MASFSGKVIAVTGAASGIGLATAHLLASRGATLSLADVQEQALQNASASITEKHSAKVHTFALDVRSRQSVDAWTAEIISTFGKLDGAANLAGVIGKGIGTKGIQDTEEEEWDFIIGVNLTGVFHCLRSQLGVLAEGGSLVNAASIAGLMGRSMNGAYSASKHGVVGLTRSAAKEVGVRNIRVNCIAPGRIETPMVAAARKIEGIQDQSEYVKEVSLRRSGKAEEVACLVAFLLSDESSYISGTTQSIDGGWFC